MELLQHYNHQTFSTVVTALNQFMLKVLIMYIIPAQEAFPGSHIPTTFYLG